MSKMSQLHLGVTCLVIIAMTFITSCVNKATKSSELMDGFSSLDIKIGCEKTEILSVINTRFHQLVNRSEEIWLVHILSEHHESGGGIQSTIISADSIDRNRIERIRKVSEKDQEFLLQTLFGLSDGNIYTRCYEPRHGILFDHLDTGLVEFIEICFECHQIKSVHDTLFSRRNLCPNQEIELRQLFEQ